MYGVILFAAMTTAQSAPDLGWKGCSGCNGCSGCSGCCGCCGGWRGLGGRHVRGGCSGCCGCCGGWQVVPASQGAGYAGQDGDSQQGAVGVPPAPVISAPPPAGVGVGPVRGPQSAAPREGPGRDDGGRRAGAPARVTVSLPANGRLFVDGVPVEDAAGGGTFLTPELQRGQQYAYEMRAEVVVDGKTVSQTRHVTLGAGDRIRADFSTLGRGADVTASAR